MSFSPLGCLHVLWRSRLLSGAWRGFGFLLQQAPFLNPYETFLLRNSRFESGAPKCDSWMRRPQGLLIAFIHPVGSLTCELTAFGHHGRNSNNEAVSKQPSSYSLFRQGRAVSEQTMAMAWPILCLWPLLNPPKLVDLYICTHTSWFVSFRVHPAFALNTAGEDEWLG